MLDFPHPGRSTKTFISTTTKDTGDDLIGLEFMDEGERYTITGTSKNDGVPTLTYIDPLKPLSNKDQHESTVKEVRKWYNTTQFLLTFESYKHITGKTYDVKLNNHTNKKAPSSYKQAANVEPQWFSAEDKEGDGILEFSKWRRLNQTTVTPEMHKKALRAHYLYNIKRDGSAKVRVVANGARQHPDTFTDTTSNYNSVFTWLSSPIVNTTAFRWT
jgi:hypothetical protein